MTTIIIMAMTTIIEHFKGTEFVSSHIYGSWWFCSIWILLSFAAIIWLIKKCRNRIGTLIIHISILIILTGALITHLTSYKGLIHIRIGEQTNKYITIDENNSIEEHTLPFSIKLTSFNVKYHDGTTAEQDYISHFNINDGNHHEKGEVSMNNIYSYKGIRLYQNSFDTDGQGSYLTINSDPYGISVTYIGYFLLFISLIWMLINPTGSYRKLLRNPILHKGAIIFLLFFTATPSLNATNVIPKEAANKFGQLYISYNGRICPLQTYAIDFTKKIYGRTTYNGYTAEQILMSWIFYADDWDKERIIKIKNSAISSKIGVNGYASVSDFLTGNSYKLSKTLQEYYNGNKDNYHQSVAELDDRLQLIMSLREGSPLKIFPHTGKDGTIWYSPADSTKGIPYMDKLFIKNYFPLLYGQIVYGNTRTIDIMIGKMLAYQKRNGGTSLPSELAVNAEYLYNNIPFANILFIINLTMGFLTLFYTIYRLTRKSEQENHTDKIIQHSSVFILIISLILLTCCEILRWMISGCIPMSNGYETMLLIAWFIMGFSILTYRYFKISITFGFLLSGFFLLVSHISQMDPAITPMMPVLNSPLLSIHVSIIMMAYALLALTFICGITAIIINTIYKIHHTQGQDETICNPRLLEQIESLQVLSRLFLYPALTTLGIGIFIGAIWANVSWGQYWSWDPKEVWALITFMVYAIVVHTESLPVFKKPMKYHIYITLAFLTILMTYFGVNYFLGGMHSYA